MVHQRRTPSTIDTVSLISFATERLLALVERSDNGRPFDPATPMRPPAGRRRSWAHYGVMLPGLPDPHRAFGVMALLGTPGVPVMANDELIRTTPNDTAYVVAATSSMTEGQFAAYRMSTDCEFAPDGSSLRFGGDVLIEGSYPDWTVRRQHPQVQVELEIRASDKVAHFMHLPGVYDHWSLLGQATGRIVQDGTSTDISGLCTLEYACGTGPQSVTDRRLPSWLRVPARFFTYQVLDVDDQTQLLFTHVLGPGGLRIKSAVYERSLGAHGNVLTFGHVWAVHEYDEEPLTTPDGRVMWLPKRFSWRVADDDRHEAVRIDGHAHGDWAYGLGAGFVGTYDYLGFYRDREIRGVAYIEYIDCR